MNYNDATYYSLLPLIISLEVVVLLFTYFALTWSKRNKSEEHMSRIHKSFIGIYLVEFWYWITRPFLTFFKFAGLTPNSITAISIVLSFVTGGFYAFGHIGWAGWMVIISGTLDMLDGALARETGQSTKSGAYFDSCSDRFSDSFVYSGIALYFLNKNHSLSTGTFTISVTDYAGVVIVMTLLMGVSAMSYVKARGEVAGFTTKRGLMQRPERVMMLSVFSVLNPFMVIILQRYGINTDAWLLTLLFIMSLLINISAISRMASIFRDIKRSEKI